MSFHNYDPRRVFIHLANAQITGFADGTFITVERQTESFMSVAGANGDVGRSRSRDKRGNIRLSILGGHRDNDTLSALIALDEQLGTGVGVFSMTDGNGTSLVTGGNTWIKKPANLERGKEMGMVDWDLECAELEILVGGML